MIDPTVRFGIISDIDDTVMVTLCPARCSRPGTRSCSTSTPGAPCPGWRCSTSGCARPTAAARSIYLSTGAWNVAPTLSRFLSRNFYPQGPLLLTDWGPTHDRWFRSGRLHKEQSLRRLASEFPDLKWLLVGDDGQHDEELYGGFLRDHPENVEAVAIRQLSSSEAVFAGGRSRSEEHERTTHGAVAVRPRRRGPVGPARREGPSRIVAVTHPTRIASINPVPIVVNCNQ